MNYGLTINGVSVAEPIEEGIKVSDEPIWDADAGRDLTGTMIAKLITWKRTVEVTWRNLTMAEAATIANAVGVGSVSTPFFNIVYNDISLTNRAATEGRVTINVYASSIPRTIRSLSALASTQAADTQKRIGDVTITFVER